MDIEHIKDLDRTQNADGDGIWNVFVQVLMPLIIILSFIAALDIAKYKETAELLGEENDDLIDSIKQFENSQKKTIDTKYKAKIVENQRLMLINALGQIIVNEKERLYFYKYKSGDSVKMDGITISDPLFKRHCRDVKHTISNDISSNSKQKYWDNIYGQVLEKSKIRDREFKRDGEKSVKQWDERYISFGKDAISNKDGDNFSARKNKIWKSNRYFIHNEIIKSVDLMLADQKRVQLEVMDRIYESLLINLRTLDDESRILVNEMINAKSVDKQQEKANAFYNIHSNKLQRTLDADGYQFLQATWDNFSKIEL